MFAYGYIRVSAASCLPINPIKRERRCSVVINWYMRDKGSMMHVVLIRLHCSSQPGATRGCSSKISSREGMGLCVVLLMRQVQQKSGSWLLDETGRALLGEIAKYEAYHRAVEPFIQLPVLFSANRRFSLLWATLQRQWPSDSVWATFLCDTCWWQLFKRVSHRPAGDVVLLYL